MPFYNREGYRRIGTDKAYFLGNVIVNTGKILLPAAAVYLAVLVISLRKEFWRRLLQRISLTDLFAAGYGLTVIMSWFLSEYKERALWGATGWYMGFWPQMSFVLTYLLVSKLWKPRRWLLYMTLVSSAAVFLLGYLNRMGIDPLNMGVNNASFISTIGNINWYCGYLVSVFFAGTALLWQEHQQKRWQQLLLMLYVSVGFASLLTQGSDSGIAALGVVMLAMFVLSAADRERMVMFWLEMVLLGGAGLITCFVLAIAPDALSLHEGYGIWLSTGWRPFFVTGLSIMMTVLLWRSGKSGVYPERTLRIASRIMVVFSSALIIFLTVLIILNTKSPGILGPLSKSEFFTFSEKWGSSRGATWGIGWKCFAEQGILHKLVGVGPDSMSAYLYTDAGRETMDMTEKSFGQIILTNTHNEWLTVLVNTGIFGLAAFAGMMITGIHRFLKEAGRNRFVCACGFCLLAYTVNNMFSFQQCMSTATVFAVFGMGGAFLRAGTPLFVREANTGDQP